ncbi:MAG: matrixin family metalloprotease [bacterium]
MAVATHRRNSGAWRIAMAVVSLGLMAWGGAAYIYLGATSARADSGQNFHDVESVFIVPQNGEWYTVKIGFFMFDKGDGSFAGDADTARTEMLARFPGAVEVPPGSVAAQYVLSGFKWTTGAAAWGYNGSGAPAGVAGTASSALQAAANTWGSQGANFHFTGGGASGADTGACGGGTDGVNTVGWGAQSGSVLAVTCSWYSNSGNPKSAVEFDMQIDPEWTWTTGSPIQVDLQSVTLHEFGHALGLNHSAQGTAVMYASYSQGANKRTPAQDDIDGELAIYGATGGGATNTPTNAPTNTPTSVATATPTRTNTPFTTPTNTPTASGSTTATPTPTQPSSTSTPTPQATSTPTSSATPSGGSTSTPTPTSTNTPTPTSTPTQAATATPTSGGGSSLPLVPGANLLAWPGSELPPAQALGNVPNLRIVYAWDPVTHKWSRYVPGAPNYLNSLQTMKKGVAYWFIATASGSVPFQP